MTPILETVTQLEKAREKAEFEKVYALPFIIASEDGEIIATAGYEGNKVKFDYLTLAANSSPALCDAVTRLVEVVKWYAEANWAMDISQESWEAHAKRAYNDGGHRARQALKDVGA